MSSKHVFLVSSVCLPHLRFSGSLSRLRLGFRGLLDGFVMTPPLSQLLVSMLYLSPEGLSPGIGEELIANTLNLLAKTAHGVRKIEGFVAASKFVQKRLQVRRSAIAVEDIADFRTLLEVGDPLEQVGCIRSHG